MTMRQSWFPITLVPISALLFIALAVIYCASAAEADKNSLCHPHCRSGCSTRGPGKCDSKCGPRYRLDRMTWHCRPVCGRGCLICAKYWMGRRRHRHCLKCRPGYRMLILQRKGESICVGGPGRGGGGNSTSGSVCDPNCDSKIGCSVQGVGKCDSVCNPNFILDNATYLCSGCDPKCSPTTPGSCNMPGGCIGTCIPGYAVDPITLQCAGCAPGCTKCSVAGVGKCDADGCDSYSIYDSGTLTCLPCADNCTGGCANTGAGFCDGPCAAGYGLTNTTAPSTKPKCAACDSECDSTGCTNRGAGFCDSGCKPGYGLDTTTHTCEQCQNPSLCSPAYTCPAPGTCNSNGCILPAKPQSGGICG